MTNEERRVALAMARTKAVQYATKTETYAGETSSFIEKAKMWAAVAEALKDGNPAHDGVTGDPADLLTKLEVR